MNKLNKFIHKILNFSLAAIATAFLLFLVVTKSFQKPDNGFNPEITLQGGHSASVLELNDEPAISPQKLKTKKSERPLPQSPWDKINSLKIHINHPETTDSQRMGMIVDLINLYVATDASKCFEWIRSLGESDINYKIALRLFAGKTAANQHSFWLGAIQNFPPGPSRDLLILGGISGIADEDVQRAWDEFQTLKELVGSQEAAMNDVVRSFARHNPELTWDILFSDQSLRENELIFGTFFNSARFSDQYKAVDALNLTFELKLNEEVIPRFTQNLRSEKVSDFINAMYQDQSNLLDKDQIAWALLNRTFYDDPIASSKATLHIEDDNLRSDIQRKLFEYVTFSNHGSKDAVIRNIRPDQ